MTGLARISHTFLTECASFSRKCEEHRLMLHIGCVNYINALPFFLPFELRHLKSDIQLDLDIPTHLNTKLRKKELNGALSSSVEFLVGEYTMLTSFGIAAEQSVLSVNLYSQIPLSSLDGKRLGITHQSATSAELLKILCKHYWKIDPLFETFDHQKPFTHYPAFLLIGNEALHHLTIPGFQTIDLASIWYEWTGLPFVFALFFLQKSVPKEKIKQLETTMHAALNWSRKHAVTLEKEAASRCRIPEALAHRYLDGLHYYLGERELEGLKLFKKMRHSDV